MVDLLELLKATRETKGKLEQRADPAPRNRRYTVVSVDDHVLEPPDVFEGRLPARFAESAPRVSHRAGADWWTFDDEEIPLLGADIVQSWEPGTGYSGPVSFEDARQGTWDIHARVRDMDLNGVAASLNFPSTPFGFAGQAFMRMKDRLLGLASMRAYNDWIHEVWSTPHPDRIIPCQVTWLHDPKIAAQEIERNAARGFKAVSFTENPWRLGLPSIYQSHWEPFLRACEETETVVNLHVGSSSETLVPGPDSSATIGVLFPVNAFATTADWLYAGVPIRFPNIKIALSEGGIGWVPMLIDRIEYGLRHGGRAGAAFGKENPIDLLRRNFWFTTFSDPRTLALRHEIGVNRIMVETDYPHSDSSWPDTQEILAVQLHGIPDDEADLITWRNAAELYRHPVEVPGAADLGASSGQRTD
jgi:predicted TIM-barrel fold metal-dependent hydrolase